MEIQALGFKASPQHTQDEATQSAPPTWRSLWLNLKCSVSDILAIFLNP